MAFLIPTCSCDLLEHLGNQKTGEKNSSSYDNWQYIAYGFLIYTSVSYSLLICQLGRK